VLTPSMGAQSIGGIHPEVDHLDSSEGSKWIQKCRKILNRPELDEGLLNLHLLVNVALVLENFLGLTNDIHRLFSALTDGKQILEQLEDP
jgi:hypothetical protein